MRRCSHTSTKRLLSSASEQQIGSFAVFLGRSLLARRGTLPPEDSSDNGRQLTHGTPWPFGGTPASAEPIEIRLSISLSDGVVTF